MSDDKKIVVDIEISRRRIIIHSSLRFDSRFCFVDGCPGVDSSWGYQTYSLTIKVGQVFDIVSVAANLLLKFVEVLDINQIETLQSITNLEVLAEANSMLQRSVERSLNKENLSEEEKKGLKGYLEKLEDELDELYNEMEELDEV